MAHPSPQGEGPVPDLTRRGLGDLEVLRGVDRLMLRRTAPGMREYELVAEGTLVGDLVASGREGFLATGECLGEAWALAVDRPFFSLGRIGVRMLPVGGDEEGLRYRGWGWGWGKVTLPDDRCYSWGGHGLNANILRDAGGRRILRFKIPFLRFLRSETLVHLGPGAHAMEALPRLLLLCSFLRLHVASGGWPPFRKWS